MAFAASCSFLSTQTKQDKSSFNCAACQHGTSLNKQPGPDLLNSLIGLFSRFRKERIALVADIEVMYHQVRVDPKDQKYLRFLWWPNGNTSILPLEYCMTIHVFGATSSPTCVNYAMQQTAKDNAHLYSDKVLQTVAENFYMDDCSKSLHSVNEANVGVKFNTYHSSFGLDGITNIYKHYRFDRSGKRSKTILRYMAWSWCTMKIHQETSGHWEELSSYTQIAKIAYAKFW